MINNIPINTQQNCSFSKISHAIIISPHCDDAAFSMGGTLLEFSKQNTKVDIINCFNYSAYTIYPHLNNPDEITSIRKAEDRKMISLFSENAPILHYMDLKDAPLRDNGARESLYYRSIAPSESKIIDVLVENISALRTLNNYFFIPLAIGAHIDHQLCRIAGEHIQTAQTQLIYYEDQPYRALCNGNTPEVLHADMINISINISLEAKEQFLDCYSSQLYDIDKREILNYAKELGKQSIFSHERFWKYK